MHRLILVREWDAQMTGSGCCGRLTGAHTPLGGAADFAHTRRHMRDAGAIYRALRERFPEIELVVVDPRNALWLLPAVWRDARAAGRRRHEALRNVLRAQAAAAVILDGTVLFAGRLPPKETVVAEVGERLRWISDAA